jgi:hypothetical protein
LSSIRILLLDHEIFVLTPFSVASTFFLNFYSLFGSLTMVFLSKRTGVTVASAPVAGAKRVDQFHYPLLSYGFFLQVSCLLLRVSLVLTRSRVSLVLRGTDRRSGAGRSVPLPVPVFWVVHASQQFLNDFTLNFASASSKGLLCSQAAKYTTLALFWDFSIPSVPQSPPTKSSWESL